MRDSWSRGPIDDEAIPSPYNFVPLSEHVVLPTWGGVASHDVPFEDGISGWLDLDVTALTPIFCRGPDKNEEFFKTADGHYAIPGTTLRGALRNVVEIASFGRMGRVDDGWYGIRDLHNRFTYGQYMAEISGGQPTPLVNAGWLTCEKDGDEEQWYLQPCHFAKVEYGLIKQLAASLGKPGFNPGRKQSAVDKAFAWVGRERPPRHADFESFTEQEWRALEQEWKVPVQVLARSGTPHKDGSVRVSDYGKVARGPEMRGRLVFTGQPSEYPAAQKRKGGGNPKHHDFFFYSDGPERERIPLSRELQDRFIGAHRDAGQQGRDDIAPNPEWRFWRTRLRQGGRVPVFFITRTDRQGSVQRPEVRALGLAMMFRLAYDHSTRDLVAAVQGEAFTSRQPDLADLLFGYVRDKSRGEEGDAVEGEGALRGRVSIGQAVAQGKPTPLPAIKAVLGVPKPTFYPNYVVQGRAEGEGPSRGKAGYEWSTYMKGPGGTMPRPRGWKRYPARETWEKTPPIPPDVKSKDVFTELKPLPEKTRFRARVRVHNLLAVELGALLWAVELGGVPDARHLIGQGRPFGLGQVKLTVAEHRLRRVDRAILDDAALEGCRRTFAAYMEAQGIRGGWAQSVQIRELLALATPMGDREREREQLRYPALKSSRGRNEFVDARTAGAALPLHGKARPSPLEPVEGVADLPLDLGRGATLWPVRVKTEPEAEPEMGASAEATAPTAAEPLATVADTVATAAALESVRAAVPEVFEVVFADRFDARERSRIFKKQQQKKKVKPYALPLVPADPALVGHPELAGLSVSTTETRNIERAFALLATSTGNPTFKVRRPTGDAPCPEIVD